MHGTPPTTASLLRRKLLWMLATMAFAFTVAFIDGWLMLRYPGRQSFLGIHVDDVVALVKASGTVVIVALGAIALILTLWKAPR